LADPETVGDCEARKYPEQALGDLLDALLLAHFETEE
jgi:hypothetical protein